MSLLRSSLDSDLGLAFHLGRRTFIFARPQGTGAGRLVITLARVQRRSGVEGPMVTETHEAPFLCLPPDQWCHLSTSSALLHPYAQPCLCYSRCCGESITPRGVHRDINIHSQSSVHLPNFPGIAEGSKLEELGR